MWQHDKMSDANDFILCRKKKEIPKKMNEEIKWILFNHVENEDDNSENCFILMHWIISVSDKSWCKFYSKEDMEKLAEG